MRCFVAVDVPGHLKDVISEFQSEITTFASAKSVERKNLHFTLKFLGDLDKSQMEIVARRLEDVAEITEPFKVLIRGIGVFPSINNARIIWFGAPALSSLCREIDDKLSDLFETEKGFFPHVTIARVRTVKDTDKLKEFIKKYSNIEIGDMDVSKFELKTSKLLSDGPLHECVKVFTLGIR